MAEKNNRLSIEFWEHDHRKGYNKEWPAKETVAHEATPVEFLTAAVEILRLMGLSPIHALAEVLGDLLVDDAVMPHEKALEDAVGEYLAASENA